MVPLWLARLLGGRQAGRLLLPKVAWWPDFSALPSPAYPALCPLLSHTQPGRARGCGAGLEALPVSSLTGSCSQRCLLQPLALLDSAGP